MKCVLKSGDIVHSLTVPGNPHQNRISERIDKSTIELARSMLHEKKLNPSGLTHWLWQSVFEIGQLLVDSELQ